MRSCIWARSPRSRRCAFSKTTSCCRRRWPTRKWSAICSALRPRRRLISTDSRGCRSCAPRRKKRWARNSISGNSTISSSLRGCCRRRCCAKPYSRISSAGRLHYNFHMTDSAFPRRALLQGAAALTAASYSRVLGANDKIQLGVIGCGERGRHDMSQFMMVPTVNVAAVCDIYGEQIDKARQKATSATNFSDHRKLLEMKEIDAVLIATPDHWHSRVAIDALRAGKDVYVEKPLTLKIEEGPTIVKAARESARICQVGRQQRSGKHYLQAKREDMDTGKLGKSTLARTWWHGNTYHLRRAPASLQTKPSNLDWSRYLGPVKWRDYDPQQYYNVRAYLDFGGGQVTDLFTHWIDVVHMFMGKEIPSSAVFAGAGYLY